MNDQSVAREVFCGRAFFEDPDSLEQDRNFVMF